ncbi:hypothetical protein DTO271D3_3362 [Paecilomyces variotii]|nr:hypothetical protein DTO271D3_3362 [Paecilomyces variotii]
MPNPLSRRGSAEIMMVDGEPAASVRYLKASLLHWILPQNEASENCALDYGGDDTLHGKDAKTMSRA